MTEVKPKSLLDVPGAIGDPKFIGFLSFPFSEYKNVRLEVYKWLFDCEQRISRELHRPSSENAFSFEQFLEEGDYSLVTPIGSRIDYATAPRRGVNFTCLRYAHWGTIAGRQLDDDGFLTTFIFEKNDAKQRLRCWLTLEYIHGKRKRNISRTVPRVFKILRQFPGAKVFVNDRTPRHEQEDEWRYRPLYDTVRMQIIEAINKPQRLIESSSWGGNERVTDASPEPCTESVLKDWAFALHNSVRRCLVAVEIWKHPYVIEEERRSEPIASSVNNSEEASGSHSHYVEATIEEPLDAVRERKQQTLSVSNVRPVVKGGMPSDSSFQNTFTSPNAGRGSGSQLELVRMIFADTRSVALMDEFEETDKNGNRKYERLILREEFNYWRNGVSLRGDYVVERLLRNQESMGDITFTELKKGEKLELSRYASAQVEAKVGSLKSGETKFIEFYVPYLLRAQTSDNQVYGGWENGTLYGETTRYGIVGVRVHP